MNRLSLVRERSKTRARRVRAKVQGTTERPRLSVFISHRHVQAQIIDDLKHQTLASITTVGRKSIPTSLTERAGWIGDKIAKQAKAKKIKSVVLDRRGRLYHGRIKALADAARKAGLEM